MMDLDAAAAAMATSQGAGPAFYHALAQAELTLLLSREAEGAALEPRVFDLASGPLVLAFDSQDRLGDWVGASGLGPQPYAVLPGRVVAQLLARAGNLGLGLNFGAGTASEMVLPPQAMEWLAQRLDTAPPRADLAQIAQVLPLSAVPDAVRATLIRALAGAGGLAQRAVLARVQYRHGAKAHVLAMLGTDPAHHAPLAHSVAEALAFSGQDGAALDVIFPLPSSAIAAQILALGTDLPLPTAPPQDTPAQPPKSPGMDPATPPKLR